MAAIQRSPRRPLVLYVEDDDDVARMYGLAFGDEYEVTRVRTGIDALRQLENRDPDALPNLVVLDHQLPDITGIEVLSVIRSNHDYDHVFVVMLSNHTDPDLKEAAFRLGALQWLLKATLTPDQVARRLHDALHRKGEVG
jgi:CheY-like chemotaxis protein